METKDLPNNIKRFIKFAENAIRWDSDSSKDPGYNDAVNQIKDGIEMTDPINGSKKQDVADNLTELCQDILNRILYSSAVRELTLQFGSDNNITDAKKAFKPITMDLVNYYQKIGQKLQEVGLLDIMVDRNNKVLEREGYGFLKTNTREAAKEFQFSRNQSSTYYVMVSKLTWTLNKIVKFYDAIEYGEMYKKDRLNVKTNNEERAMILSKVKTDFLKKLVEANRDSDGEKTKEHNEIMKKKYNELFGSEFNNLDFEKDLKEVLDFEIMKSSIYSTKSLLASQILGLSFEEPIIKRMDPDIKNCGLCKEEKGGVSFGANIYGYIGSVTFHIPPTMFGEIAASSPVIIPDKVKKFETLRIKKRYKENPNDRIMKYFYSQITTREPMDTVKMIDSSEFIEEK